MILNGVNGMNKIYKILSLKSLILSLSFLLLGASIHAETTFEKIKRTGKVTVGTEAAFPPFEFIKDLDNKLSAQK